MGIFSKDQDYEKMLQKIDLSILGYVKKLSVLYAERNMLLEIIEKRKKQRKKFADDKKDEEELKRRLRQLDKDDKVS